MHLNGKVVHHWALFDTYWLDDWYQSISLVDHSTAALLCSGCISLLVFVYLEVLLSEEENRDLHQRCVEQYDHLRDEFERYKLRAQSVLKNKSSPSPKVCLNLAAAVSICWYWLLQSAPVIDVSHTQLLSVIFQQ